MPSQPSFWMPGRPPRNLSVTSLPRPLLRNVAAFDLESLGAQRPGAVGRLAAVLPRELEHGGRDVVDPAEVVVEARDLEPLALRVDHAPPGQVVERRAPQHGLLAARVHGDVAAHDRGIGRGRIDREHESGAMGGFLHPARHHAGFRVQRRHLAIHARQWPRLDRVDALELLDVDDRGKRRERHGAARVAGAAAARDHREAGFDAGAHQARHLGFGVRRQHHERRLDAPVGRVGGMRHACVGVEADVVVARVRGEGLARAATQGLGAVERCGELVHRGAREPEQPADLDVAGRVAWLAPLFDVAQAMVQRLDQQLAAARVVEQVLLEVGIAPHDPDVAQHLVQHPRRAAGAALGAQVVQQGPAFRRRAAGSRSRGRRTTCSCTGSRAAAAADRVRARAVRGSGQQRGAERRSRGAKSSLGDGRILARVGCFGYRGNRRRLQRGCGSGQERADGIEWLAPPIVPAIMQYRGKHPRVAGRGRQGRQGR